MDHKKIRFFILSDDLEIVIFRHIDFFNHRLVDSPAQFLKPHFASSRP